MKKKISIIKVWRYFFIGVLLLSFTFWTVCLPIAITLGYAKDIPEQSLELTMAIMSTLIIVFGLRSWEKLKGIDSKDIYETVHHIVDDVDEWVDKK